MLTSTSKSTKNTSFLNVLIVATAIVIGIVFFYYRLNYLNAPLGNDESVYLYLGKMAMHGGAPYRDFYEMKPPMLFYSFGILNALTGFSILGLHINAILIVIISAFLIYKTYTRRYLKLPTMLACTIWALLISSPMIYGNYLQSEHFVVLFLVLIFYLLQFRTPSNRQIFIAGLLYSAAILTKQSAIYFIVPGLFLIYELGTTTKERFQKLLIFSAGVVALVIFFLVLILAFGTFNDMMYWLFEFPASYVGRITWANGQNYLMAFAQQIFGFNAYFFGLAGIAFLFVLIGYKKRLNWFYILSILFGFASIFTGLRFYGQYWLLFVFPMCFIVIHLFSYVYKQKWATVFFGGVLLLSFVQIANAADVYFSQNVDKQINAISNGQSFDKTKKMGLYLNKLLKKEDTFMVLGAVSQLYLYVDKVAPTRHVWNTMLNIETSKNKLYQDEYLNDLSKEKPTYIFFSFSALHWNLRSSSSNYVYNKCYEFVANNYDRIAILDLKSGDLIIGEEAKLQQIKAETYVVYKRK